MSVYQALMLMISFSTLTVIILKFNQKNNRLLTLTG
ncbi:putative holin-like toxin [Companilactobacillus mishanensis]